MKQTLLPFFCCLLIVSCQESSSDSSAYTDQASDMLHATAQISRPDFQAILDSANVEGSILIYDPASHKAYSNDFDWANTGFLPASTYKIVNSLIALETGVVENEETMFYWDGTPRRIKSWEADLSLRQAFLRSCVPCYQQIARAVGHERMNQYLTQFKYGNMDVGPENIDLFWLEGDSRISQQGQIDFLQNLYEEKLDVAESSYAIMKKLMWLDETETETLYGKTGWSIRDGFNNGWFVGYIEKEGTPYYVATNVIPGEAFDMDDFASIRIKVSKSALSFLGLWQNR